jgi:uncharacterized metal-binding protein
MAEDLIFKAIEFIITQLALVKRNRPDLYDEATERLHKRLKSALRTYCEQKLLSKDVAVGDRTQSSGGR